VYLVYNFNSLSLFNEPGPFIILKTHIPKSKKQVLNRSLNRLQYWKKSAENVLLLLFY